MPLTKLHPHTILLSGRERATIINDLPVIDTGAKPGHFVELFDSSGTLAWRKVTSATNVQSCFILLEQDIQNLGLDDAYNTGDNAIVAVLERGMMAYPLVPSGQDISQADYLQMNGDGTLKEATSAAAGDGVACYQALETIGAVTALTRIRVQTL